MEKKTPLYDSHVLSGGKLVPFAGYILPIQYKAGVIAEHMAVRTKVGIFDVSHMGEIVVSGKDAVENVQLFVTNDCAVMKVGQVKYTTMCNENGGIVDDLLVYRLGDEKFLLVVNASNKDKDFEFINKHKFGEVNIEDISEKTAQIALQGPKAVEVLQKLTDEENIPKKYYTFLEDRNVSGINCLVSNTGYTGEGGFEFYFDSNDAPKMWELLLEAGEEFGLIPCGLGARDTLRFEAGMPLYGHEMNDEITPLEADLSFCVKMKKENFIGKQALIEKGELTRKRVGLKITSKGIARENCEVYVGEQKVGFTTTGTMSPYFGYPIAMALIDIEHTQVGTAVEVLVRGKRLSAEVVPLPFYKKSY